MRNVTVIWYIKSSLLFSLTLLFQSYALVGVLIPSPSLPGAPNYRESETMLHPKQYVTKLRIFNQLFVPKSVGDGKKKEQRQRN